MSFIKIPHAKVIRAQFLIGWKVDFSVKAIWAEGGDGFGEKGLVLGGK